MTVQLGFFTDEVAITIANIGPGQCRYPLGEPTHDMPMCGAPCEELRPYCSEHSKVCFVPAPKRKDRAE